ncbi:MAG TPA: DUF4296 domain-containing protein [Chitinophagaceae bacterium]|nr:DUF4296 domain-containing protein [Chitinophagaceae bacterium]
MRLIILILLIFAFSCGRKDKVPEGVLEPAKMEKVMTDLLMSESFTESYLLLDTSKKRDEWFTGELNKVLAIQDVTQDQIRKSLDFYRTRPDLFKVIVDSINARAQRNRDKVYDMEKRKRIKVE